jgi:Beta-L-arabinofuranosidase, GH127
VIHDSTQPTTPAVVATALQSLPLGAIKPSGWLLEQLRLQADGLTGHLEELWADVGPNSAWLGGAGEDWERGPYYLDGLIPLAYILEDSALQQKAQRWLEAIFASQREDGFFGPLTNDDWWPRMVVLKCLTQYHSASGDPRVLAFMRRYFQHQVTSLNDRPLEGWGQARGAENALSVLWLYERTREAWLLELGRKLIAQTLDWNAYLNQRLIQTPAVSFSHHTHVVNVAMGLKYFAARAQLGFDEHVFTQVNEALRNLDRFHGMVNGMFSGDEFLAGLEPQHGVETCAVVETMYSLAHLTRTFGTAQFADRLEVIAFNALAAAMSADLRSHQYHQQVNQVLCTIAERDWTCSSADANTFGLEPHFGCCTANLHQGWPKFVQQLWMKTASGGLAAVAYAPSTVTVTLEGGVQVRLETRTNYPFEERIEIYVHSDQPVRFALELRIPGWCHDHRLSVNAHREDRPPNERGFVILEREWCDGDRVELEVPQHLRRIERPNGAAALMLGPVTLALAPGEVWSHIPDAAGFGDWEVRFRSSWNYALEIHGLSDANLKASCRIERFDLPSPPFSLRRGSPPIGVEGVPLRVFVPARRLLSWSLERDSAAPPPRSPVQSLQDTSLVALVPYGSARIRIAEFPVLAPNQA